MASPKEIELVGEIQRAVVRVNMQGKYNIFCSYSGHVQLIEVHAYHTPWSPESLYVEGWDHCEHNVYLSTGYVLGYGEKMPDVIEYKVELLEKLKADLIELLDVDADGVPV